MSLRKPIPITILLTLSVAISVAATAAATSTGALEFLGIGPTVTANTTNNVPLINGTIINNDNKTFSVLIIPSNGTVTPTPEPVPTPTCPDGFFYNTTSKECQAVVEPEPEPIPTCPTGQFYNTTSKQCQTSTIPAPTPTPIFNETLKVILTGDIEDSTAGNAVFNQIKSRNPSLVVLLGDLGYESDLSWFKSTYGTLGNKVFCVIGNHEAANEDGSSSLETETKNYCSNSYWIKKGPTLFLGFNTNGDLTSQATSAGKLLSSLSFMKGIKSVHIMSHKPCAVPPNSHHGIEIQSFCDAIKSKIPTGVKAYYDQAHNHIMSESADGTYKQIGAGGKSHYECGTDSAFPFCDNSHYGFLEYTIKPDGTTTRQFIDYNGSVLR